MRSLVLFSAPLALSLLLPACGSKEYLHATAVVSPDVRIDPGEIWIGGHKLWVRSTLVNSSNEMVTVMRDNIVARLPNGTTVPRASGAYTQHVPYVIPAGGAHAVYVEFEAHDFEWDHVGAVQVDFSNGVLKGGHPIQVPPLVIQ